MTRQRSDSLSYMRECSVIDIYCNPYCWKTERNKFRWFRDKAGTDIELLNWVLNSRLLLSFIWLNFELWERKKEYVLHGLLPGNLDFFFFFFWVKIYLKIPQRSKQTSIYIPAHNHHPAYNKFLIFIEQTAVFCFVYPQHEFKVPYILLYSSIKVIKF